LLFHDHIHAGIGDGALGFESLTLAKIIVIRRRRTIARALLSESFQFTFLPHVGGDSAASPPGAMEYQLKNQHQENEKCAVVFNVKAQLGSKRAGWRWYRCQEVKGCKYTDQQD
jgi:hypothetical protein